MLRTVGIVALVLLLGVNTAAANAVVVADRTVLDPGFVRQALDAEDAYEELTEVAVETVESGDDDAAPAGMAGLGIDQTAVVEASLTPSYLQAQTEANVGRTYAFLHGERDDLVISFDPEPVEDRAAATVEAQVANASSSAIISELVGDGTIEVEGVEVDLGILARMAEGESAYVEARQSTRADVEAAVLDRFEDEAFRSSSNDELLALVIEDYDPSAYSEAEKADMVETREGEIRDALRDRIESERADEVASAVDEQLTAIRAEARDRVEDRAAEQPGMEEGLVDPATAMVHASVDGLTTDLSHDEYSDRLDDEQARLAANAGSLAGGVVASQLPVDADVTAEMSAAERRQLDTVRSAVAATGVLVFVLPFLGICLIGGLWWLSRSPAVTAGGAGAALAVGALPGVVIADRLPSMARSAFGDPGMPGLGDVLIGLADRAAGVLLTQSLVLVGLGVVAVAVGVAFHLDDRGTISLPSR